MHTYFNSYRRIPSHLGIDFFPHLIHLSSKLPQAEEFWPRLLEAAPKLKYIHTNYKPLNLLELKNQRPSLKFMPYQDIFGESSELAEFIHFRDEVRLTLS
ncbi:hypothetical protein DSO57_1033766 [Entomophthora muscae]|uniref:Uncharacterized protein n=1 Tax=Entomophthora muscae TaxID=34485 RepID=A0ACC2TYN4_9FUNG|nr:hypothetical protein DSO57_1033766 [Entomophthora muscae]